MAALDDYLEHAFTSTEAEETKARLPGPPHGPPVALPMLVRVSDPQWEPLPGYNCEVSSRLGDVVVCRLPHASLRRIASDPRVISIDASRPAGPLDCAVSMPFVGAQAVHVPPLSEKGDGAVIALIDGGVDLLHQAFLDDRALPAKRTRILALWDQEDPTGPPPKVAGRTLYGTLHTRAQIDGYLAAGAVPPGLFRDPALHAGIVHGTHVASIAAGRAAGAFFGGVAPEAKMIVVIPKLEVSDNDPVSLGYSSSHLDALSFIREVAGEAKLPVVVNLSQGMNAGAHDGSSALEAAFDAFSGGGRTPGHVIVKSAGNERAEKGHAQLVMAWGTRDFLEWDTQISHGGPDVIELWWSSADDLRFVLKSPKSLDGEESKVVSRSSPRVSWISPSGNEVDLSLTRFHHDNGDSRLLVAIRAGTAAKVEEGTWSLQIDAVETPAGGALHAWLERSNTRPIELRTTAVNEHCTLTIPGTAGTVVCVASIDAKLPPTVARSSCFGPTRDARHKPEIAAPGERIKAALAGSGDDVVVMSGTSMAAPHVTGAIALLFSAWAKRRDAMIAAGQSWEQLNAVQVRAALIQSANKFTGHWSPGLGYGRLDCQTLLAPFL